MKNKKAAQIESKREHLAEVQAAKARRRGEPILERAIPTRSVKPTLLIVCEGRNTEPSYFNQFKLTSATIKALGSGNNTISLVRQAIDLKAKGAYDEVWCVFDKDDFSANDFNNAIAIALANNLKIAYSNQSFEYWLILHFEDHQGGAMHRDDYESKINDYIEPFGASYDGTGSKIISKEFFDILMAKENSSARTRVEIAIGRAERNYNNWDHESPALEESSTLVFDLVKVILAYI